MNAIEVVRIKSRPGEGTDFQTRLERGLQAQAMSPECLAIRVHRCIENPDEFLLELEWTSVDAHLAWATAGRESWRAGVGWDHVGGIETPLHYCLTRTVKESGTSLNQPGEIASDREDRP